MRRFLAYCFEFLERAGRYLGFFSAIFLLNTSPLLAADNLFILRGSTLTDEVEGFIRTKNNQQVQGELLRQSCGRLPFDAGDILTVDADTLSCTLYEDQRARLRPSLEDMVLDDSGRQTDATVKKTIDNAMLAYYNSAAQAIFCTPPHAGATCVNATDTTPPLLQLPANIATTTLYPTGALVSFSVSATDNIDPAPITNCTPSSGSTFPIGLTNVHCSASDAGGNHATGSFTVVVTLMRTLTVLVNGSGIVVGQYQPYPEISCPGVCSADYPNGVMVQLSANPSWHSHFTGWTGCVSDSSACVATMDASKSVSADFALFQTPVLIYGDRGYSSLPLAIAALSLDGIILAKATYHSSTPEALLFNQAFTINLQGGMDEFWVATSGATHITGTLTIQSGRLNVNGIKLRP